MAQLIWSIQHRRDTAANWTAENPILLPGQIGIETDTNFFKFGTGANWNSTTYVATGGGGQVDSVAGTTNRITVDNTDPANPIINISSAYDTAITNAINTKAASVNQIGPDVNGNIELEASDILMSDGIDTETAINSKSNRPSELLSGGIISIGSYGGSGSNNDIRVTASTFYILGSGNFSAIQTDFLDITLSSSGNQRYIGLYGTTSNTITKVEGSESAYAVFPTQPANTALIGYVLVGDASISTTPDLSGYLLKSSKATAADIITGTDDTTYITPLALKNSGSIITTIASSASPTFFTSLNPETVDQLIITTLSVNTIIPAPTAAIVQGKRYIVSIKDNGISKTVGFNSVYRFKTSLPNPGSTVASETLRYGGIGNTTDNKIDIVAIS